MEIMEIIKSMDFVIFVLVGATAGWLAGQVKKDSNLIGNIIIGIVGSVVSGFVFDWLDFMNVGDIADPLIAGAVGAVILLTIAHIIRR